MKRSALLVFASVLVPLAARAADDCERLRWNIVPLPVYATLPNEGDTFGAMPVFLHICEPGGTTRSILAPSLTWNDVIHVTNTWRFYHYPSPTETFNFIASISTRINSNLLLQWESLPTQSGAITWETEARWQRSAFFRFFGLGPDTAEGAETSYTRVKVRGSARAGVNLDGGWNLGAMVQFHEDEVQDLGVPGLPLSRRTFPGAPGMGGATSLSQLVDLRYDTRPHHEFSDKGVLVEASAGPVEGLRGSPTYLRAAWALRAIQPELSWLAGAARLDVSWVSTGGAPFYEQSTLGGAFLLRGFTEDRFIDRSAWTAELEQRIRILQTHIYGVTADWRIDPFVAAGQVFGPLHQAFSNPRLAGGLGFRALVHPNVLGRVDVATGGEGVKVYVEIGYPY